MSVRQLKFFAALCMSANDRESDLGGYKYILDVGKFTNTKPANNGNQLKMVYILCLQSVHICVCYMNSIYTCVHLHIHLYVHI